MTKMASKMRSNEFATFDATMRKLMSVSHDEIKAKLDAEKHAKRQPAKRKSKKAPPADDRCKNA